MESSAQIRLAANARRLREERGLTQEDVGVRSGLTASHISRMETGRLAPTLRTLESLAEGIGCDIAELFRRPEDAGASAQEWDRRGALLADTASLLPSDIALVERVVAHLRTVRASGS
jgi:transcriptional regulator with XRE-family HTH domain